MKKTIVQNIGLVLVSVALSLIAMLIGLKLCTYWLKIYDPSFHYENQLDMWDADPTIGFVNKQNFTTYAWGTVRVHTNEGGFRGSRSLEFTKKEGVGRIIGVGDSVMWGAGVNGEDSFLGILERKLNMSSMQEVFNGGVVGYSTYQELLYLEKYALPLRPDIVLVNHCANDLLPSEDPFGNVREILFRYLDNLVPSTDRGITPEMRAKFGDLIRIFRSPSPVWMAIDVWKAEGSDRERFIRETFIERPIARMAQLTRAGGVRLIYVLIPPKALYPGYVSEVDQLKSFLTANGIEFVDVRTALLSDNAQLFNEGGVRLRGSNWVWLSELRQILLLWQIERIHQNQNFLDSVHPSRRGNEIIAEHIYQYLLKS